jgi:hypothetical protein
MDANRNAKFPFFAHSRMTFAKQILDYHFGLSPNRPLPEGVHWLMPYAEPEVRRVMRLFYRRFYNDKRKLTFILGINPGRFGAGVTGIPFTDPIRLDALGIPNAFPRKPELSSVFIYAMIDACGGPDVFYGKYHITSLSPLGLLKDGRNYNYYDDRDVLAAVEPFIVENINAQLAFGANRDVVYCLGQGQNMAHLERLNAVHGWWKRVVPLPHPRWIMQYRLKEKDAFVRQYKSILFPPAE